MHLNLCDPLPGVTLLNGRKLSLRGSALLVLLALFLSGSPSTNIVFGGSSSIPEKAVRSEDSRHTAVASQSHLYDRPARSVGADEFAVSHANGRDVPAKQSYAPVRMVEPLLTVVEIEYKIYPAVRTTRSSDPQPPARGSSSMLQTGVSSTAASHVGTVVLLI